MTLNDWLTSTGTTEAVLAELLRCRQVSVNRYRHGRVPRPAILERIVAVTDGQVTPNDFHKLPERQRGEGTSGDPDTTDAILQPAETEAAA